MRSQLEDALDIIGETTWYTAKGLTEGATGRDAAVYKAEDVFAAFKKAQKKGRWERKSNHLLCPFCEWRADPFATPFCPGCGAYLGGE